MVHLHLRSHFSLLKGTMSINKLVSLAIDGNIDTLCLSDYKSMYGSYTFYKECLKNNIKPLFAIEMEVMLEKDNPLLINVIAKNKSGYQALLELVSYLNIQSSIMSMEELIPYCENTYIIILKGGLYEKSIIQQDEETLLYYLRLFKESFKNLGIGLINQESSLWKKRNGWLSQLCLDNELLYVACCYILYEKKGDEALLQVLKAIDQNTTLKQLGSIDQIGRYFKNAAEMRELYSQEALDNAQQLADSIDVVLDSKPNEIIKYPTNNNVDCQLYLRELCYAGLKKRLNNQITKPYVKRLEYELTILCKMHFEDYFLIVYDYIKFARSKNILVGSGRGSAAGCLVAYVLGITHVDPIVYGLLFERFLNEERISMPDIDVDFPDNERDVVINYVKDKYGSEHVAHIATFGTLKAKQVLRDVGRVLEVLPSQIDLLNKKIPFSTHTTLMDTYQNVPVFKQLINSKPELSRLFDIALKLEGSPRHVTTHAAGIIISNEPLVKSVPLIKIEDDMFSTQYPADCLEELGLLKMDFLGLRNLTIIAEVLQEIKDTYHKNIDIMHLDLNDAATIKLLFDVDTIGIFQLESDGMKQLMRKIKVNCFDDVVVTIALFRPGPMENIPEYLKRRDRKMEFTLHPKLDPILKPTYGIMIYQEQIMLVAQVMASFSLAKADVLRRAMSKKKENELLSLRSEFVDGALRNGFERALIDEVYELILKFANYGFNKSHSVAYGMIAYQMAYLKANYPLAFLKALLNSVIGSEHKTYEYFEESHRRGIALLPISINYSNDLYQIRNEALRLPLALVKGVGNVGVNEILKERAKGDFKSFFDFVARCNNAKVNRKVIEALIDAGAFDEFNYSRLTLLQNLDEAIQYGGLVRIEEVGTIRLNFDLVSLPHIKNVKDNMLVKCEREKSVLGFYFSKHPISLVKQQLNITTSIPVHNGVHEFVCVINRIKTHRTKNGEMMAFLNGSDETNNIDLVLMPNLYQNFTKLQKDDYVLVKGKLDERGSVLVNQMRIVNASMK